MDEYDVSVGIDPSVSGLFSQVGSALGGGAQGGFSGGVSGGMNGGAFYGMGGLGTEFSNFASGGYPSQSGTPSQSSLPMLLILGFVVLAIYLLLR